MLAPTGHEMPIGLSKVTIGFPRVGINCAMCHTASVRLRPGDVPTIYPAAPSHQTAPQQYLRFLFACASDPRFTADTILAEIAKNHRLSTLDRLHLPVRDHPAHPQRAARPEATPDAWMRSRPDWGRGRIDPFNPVKFRVLEQPVDATIGNSDMVPLWNLRAHKGYAFHWDGLNTDLREVVLSSAIGDGASREVGRSRHARLGQHRPARDVEPAARAELHQHRAGAGVPVPDRSRARRAGRGRLQDASARRATRPAARAPARSSRVAEVGTDRHRLDMWTKASAAAYNAYGEGHAWKFSHFRTTDGYVSVPLDGLWLRAPYLHNGSVPTLTDLLEPVAARPTQFWRGYDVYDPVRVGFVTSGAAAEREATFFDVQRPGNSNAGHVYGTTLSAEAKRALLEFMKTL